MNTEAIESKLRAYGIAFRIHNDGIQYNVADANNIIHCYYPTTGTIVFHRESKDGRIRNIVKRNKDLDYLISILLNPVEIKYLQ